MTENIDGEQEFRQSSHFGSISEFLAVRYGRIIPGEVRGGPRASRVSLKSECPGLGAVGLSSS